MPCLLDAPQRPALFGGEAEGDRSEVERKWGDRQSRGKGGETMVGI